MIPNLETVPLLHLASGDRLSLQIYKFIGEKPGHKVYLQSNLHGAELTGNAVIHQLIQWLSSLPAPQLAGEIWLVPLCNPLGTNERSHHFSSGRFDPYSGKNWNRIFWEYQPSVAELTAFAQSQLECDRLTIERNYRAQIRASFDQLAAPLQAPSGQPFSDHYRFLLQSLCLDAHYVIDLHTSADQGLTYFYYFRNRQTSARLFMLPIGILLDEYAGGAFDEAFIKPWLALEDCFATLGRKIQFDIEAWTLELGSAMQIDTATVERGVQAVKNYLLQKGILRVPAAPQPMPSIAAMKLAASSQMKKYYAPVGGMVQSRVALGSSVEAGQRLYQILSFNKGSDEGSDEGSDVTSQMPRVLDICAEQAGIVYEVSINHAVNQGEYVLGIL